jgi:hypothetical protein
MSPRRSKRRQCSKPGHVSSAHCMSVYQHTVPIAGMAMNGSDSNAPMFAVLQISRLVGVESLWREARGLRPVTFLAPAPAPAFGSFPPSHKQQALSPISWNGHASSRTSYHHLNSCLKPRLTCTSFDPVIVVSCHSFIFLEFPAFHYSQLLLEFLGLALTDNVQVRVPTTSPAFHDPPVTVDLIPTGHDGRRREPYHAQEDAHHFCRCGHCNCIGMRNQCSYRVYPNMTMH